MLTLLGIGKFHMEMVVWHNAHWATWGRQKFFDDIFPALYETLLPSSIARAKAMGWDGARFACLSQTRGGGQDADNCRWPKMTELNTGVSSPGGINGLLLWQQVSSTMHLLSDRTDKITASSYVPGGTSLSGLSDARHPAEMG